jgi:hypothetical protein
MDWIIWVIVIVVIVGVVWWLLNRNSSGNTTGTSRSSDSGASAPLAEPTFGRPADGPLATGGTAVSEADAMAGMAGAAGLGTPGQPVAPPAAEAARERKQAAADAGVESPGLAPAGGDVDDWDERPTPSAGATAVETGRTGRTSDADKAEWEAQWSEAGSTPHSAGIQVPDTQISETQAQESPAQESGERKSPAADARPAAPVHHPEYTEPHAPTLPGAESAAAEDVLDTGDAAELPRAAGTGASAGARTGTGAAPTRTGGAETGTTATETRTSGAQAQPGTEAAETQAGAASDGDAETMQAATSSAVTEAGASHTAEPAGHLAADQPYGEGSAAPGADGQGPAGYTVKGDAQSMTYHDESSPAYEETKAGVWFESVAHAEAAGFRAPRRSRH